MERSNDKDKIHSNGNRYGYANKGSLQYPMVNNRSDDDIIIKKTKMGYDLKNDWLIFMTTMFNSNILLFDLSKLDNNTYIIDGREERPINEWKFIRGDFRVFMNKIFMANGAAYWTW